MPGDDPLGLLHAFTRVDQSSPLCLLFCDQSRPSWEDTRKSLTTEPRPKRLCAPGEATTAMCAGYGGTGQLTRHCSAPAAVLHPAAGRRRTHFRRLCSPRAPASVPGTGAGPDGRAGSSALRSAAREPPACAAGLMHSTRAHGTGIAAISAILSKVHRERHCNGGPAPLFSPTAEEQTHT
jgi:hypothetical protein